jgi:hypothetical protein
VPRPGPAERPATRLARPATTLIGNITGAAGTDTIGETVQATLEQAGLPSDGSASGGSTPQVEAANTASAATITESQPAAAGDPTGTVEVVSLPGGTLFDLGDTQVVHQLQGGLLSSIQNVGNGVSVQQFVELSVTISNFNSVFQGALQQMKASQFGFELAKFGSTLGN